MTRLPSPRAAAALAAAALAVGGLGLAASAKPALALINETSSVPRGLYVRSLDPEPRPGRLVALPQPTAATAYLAGLGVPAKMRLLKRVVAVGGERVCAAPGMLQTPRRRVAVPAIDRRGVTLPAWRGCRDLAADELMLLGDSATSFDGRYFGPVRRDAVEGAYEEVFRW